MVDTPQGSVGSDGMNRRAALTKLGLAVTAVYVAPTILHLERTAQAVTPSCNGGGKNNPWCGKGGKGGKGGK